jgi:hypothetical protein
VSVTFEAKPYPRLGLRDSDGLGPGGPGGRKQQGTQSSASYFLRLFDSSSIALPHIKFYLGNQAQKSRGRQGPSPSPTT